MCLLPFCKSAGKIPSSPGDLYGDIVSYAHLIRSSVTISEAIIQLVDGIHFCFPNLVLLILLYIPESGRSADIHTLLQAFLYILHSGDVTYPSGRHCFFQVVCIAWQTHAPFLSWCKSYATILVCFFLAPF